ncbi:hypothetical protein [Oceanobacillus oncorhynchi]|uniref:hypothetical protein n=1 Tax=Oceanobacillus oncorhynchi TaxID=545501 RepID=UPI002F968915
MSDNELNEHVAYYEGRRFRGIIEKEFDRRIGREMENEREINELSETSRLSQEPFFKDFKPTAYFNN